MPQPTPEQLQTIEDALLAGNKIAAIKLHREATGCGLKESKEWVEARESKLRGSAPEKFSSPAKTGCLGLLAFGIIAGAFLLHHLA